MLHGVLTEIKVLLCGVCGAGFVIGDELRAHTAQKDPDGDSHDGEPWGTMMIAVGDERVWERGNPLAEERITVNAIRMNDDDDMWIQTTDAKGDPAWNDLGRYVEAITPLPELDPAPSTTDASWWFIQYGFRRPGDGRLGWNYAEDLTRMHPCAWLIDYRRRAHDNGWNQVVYVAGAWDCTAEMAAKWNGLVG